MRCHATPESNVPRVSPVFEASRVEQMSPKPSTLNSRRLDKEEKMTGYTEGAGRGASQLALETLKVSPDVIFLMRIITNTAK